jgi:hypothetical protein
MHYRKDHLSSVYFDKDHPENAPLSGLIQRLQERFGYTTAEELWVHFLRYYLETPHNQIVADAFTLKSDREAMKNIFNGVIDPDIQNFEALAYDGQATEYYLTIWEAAPGTEFIISNTSFGLWEGALGSIGGLHRLFVISPRIAIVLRSNSPNGETPGTAWQGDLLDIQSERPTPAYVGGLNPFANLKTNQEIINYKMTDAAQRDEFKFKVVKLTEIQTYRMNVITMINTVENEKGAFTFGSLKCMYTSAGMGMQNILALKPTRFHLFLKMIARLEKELPVQSDEPDAAGSHVSHKEVLLSKTKESTGSSSDGPSTNAPVDKQKMSKKERFAKAISLG